MSNTTITSEKKAILSTNPQDMENQNNVQYPIPDIPQFSRMLNRQLERRIVLKGDRIPESVKQDTEI